MRGPFWSYSFVLLNAELKFLYVVQDKNKLLESFHHTLAQTGISTNVKFYI